MPGTQQSTSSSRSVSNTKTGVVPGMMGVYNQLMGLNQQNYQNILSGYQTAQQQLAQGLGQVYSGYGTVESNVMRMLGVDGGGWGVATPGANSIRQQATAAQGATQQNMINAGLGNSTVLASMTNQNALQTNQAYGELSSKLAGLSAGYETQIGLARQNAMLQGTGMQANLATNYLSDLSHYQFSNTAGPLTGQFGQTVSQSQGQSSGLQIDLPQYSTGARGGGSAQPGSGQAGNYLPSYNSGSPDQRPGDISPYNYGQGVSGALSGGNSNVIDLSGGYNDAPAGQTMDYFPIGGTMPIDR